MSEGAETNLMDAQATRAANVGKSITTRPALERIREIIKALSSGQPCNARTLAEQFATSTKTIHRDFDFLRGIGHELVYSQRSFTYSYTAPAGADPILPTSPKHHAPEVQELITVVDLVLKDTRFWWEWEDALKAVRAKFPNAKGAQ